ncbi:MAG: peroxiredoxin family protein, partial [Thermomicrobiales bacterium]
MMAFALTDPFTTALAAGLAIALVTVAILGWFCYRLLVDRGRLLLRLPDAENEDAAQSPCGLRAGAFLSDFALPTRDGGMATLSGLADRPLLIVFVQPDCLFSRAVARELADHAPDTAAPLPVLVVSGPAEDREAPVPFVDLGGPVLLDPHGQVARLMRVPLTPAGYLVDETRRTIGALLVGPRSLIAAARGEPLADLESPPQAVTPIPRAPA